MSGAPELRPLTPPHAAMTKEASQASKCAVRLLQEATRDYDLLREFIEQYIQFQHAADVVSGQVQPAPRARS